MGDRGPWAGSNNEGGSNNERGEVGSSIEFCMKGTAAVRVVPSDTFPRRCGAGRLRRVVRARGRRVQMDGRLLGRTQLPASRSGGCVPSAVHSNVGTSDGGAGSIARAISAAAASTVAHVAALHVVMRVRRCARELLTGRKGPVRRLRLLRLLRLRRLRRLRRRRWRRLLVSFRDVVRSAPPAVGRAATSASGGSRTAPSRPSPQILPHRRVVNE